MSSLLHEMVEFVINFLKKIAILLFLYFHLMHIWIAKRIFSLTRNSAKKLKCFEKLRNLGKNSKQHFPLFDVKFVIRKMSFQTLMHENEKLVGGRKRLKVLMAKRYQFYRHITRSFFGQKVIFVAFMCLEIGFVIVFQKEIDLIPARKILVKLLTTCRCQFYQHLMDSYLI